MKGREFIGQVHDNGQLDNDTRKEIAHLLSTLPGKRVRIGVQIYRRQRSDKQNAYYHGVVIPILTRRMRDLGNDVNELDVHEYCKVRFFSSTKIINTPKGPETVKVASTTEFNTEEFAERMEIIRAFGAEIGAEIPLPGEDM